MTSPRNLRQRLRRYRQAFTLLFVGGLLGLLAVVLGAALDTQPPVTPGAPGVISGTETSVPEPSTDGP